jgi:hypothetical protein
VTAQYGYNETLCIACENALGSKVQHDNWKIQQKINCGYALTGQVQDKDKIPSNKVFYYKDEGNETKVDEITLAENSAAFFTNQYWWECGAINDCKLK